MPTQPPAGRPINVSSSTRVASVDTFPDILAEDIAAYEEADKFREVQVETLAEEETRDKPSVRQDGK
ncbi:uncharacterized protein MELLADRAFT_58225 [Melampsora larici-populina 98AG31]|uniref:Uncharacterized protein n=1 Tax=Melampsora larici-populina (strain 98AG31 / pathotype 3-4-7) TaxID=747676 RepID=F4SCR0_MELLP|nr:uncharacterized protein MELLADRAFT_58225 [Melampsora larici-populina 98AG31]EGF97567.1 hypothetical protein MELLADRAFT_58225 [Melampsora larici-populina 98AG31]